jgi:RNA polymerase sigma-70 factor, ECF subfamily
MINLKDNYAEITSLFCAGIDGDQTAYGKFLIKVIPILRRLVGRRLGVSDVEDVVQEVLISIHKARHTYDGARPIMPWIASITNFRITDHLRKLYSKMQHQTYDIADYEDVLSDVSENTFNKNYIVDLLEDVPEKQKEILMMMHIDGYTVKEMSKKMGMNESAVKVAAHRAIKKIREKFGT